MTEDQIERHVEHQINRLDKRFLSSDMTQAEYDAAIKAVDAWAKVRAALIKVPYPIT